LEDDDYLEPRTRNGIVLSPQPSESLNDPLNWPQASKIVILFILSLTAGITVSLTVMLTTGFQDIAQNFDVDIDQVSFSTVGLMQIMTGSGTFFTAAAAGVWGKRPVFIISTIFLMGTNLWGFFAGSFLSLTIMRIVQGLAAAPLETLISATISELFFAHEKGKMLSIWNLHVMGGIKLGQLVASFIIQSLGIKFTFGACGILYAALLPFMYLFVYETVYLPSELETVVVFDKNSLHVYEFEVPVTKKSTGEKLRIFQGRVSKESFWHLAWKPLPLITFPAVIYAALTYTIYASGLTLIALLQDSIFSASPYNLSTSDIGLTNLPLFGVGLVATLVAGYCADFVVSFMTNHNDGTYEPEFRLILMLIATSLSTVAYLGFGFSVDRGAPIIFPIMFLCVQTMAVPFATASMFTYVMDCHVTHAAQAFVTMNFIKAVLSLVMSNFVNGWFEQVGAKSIFMTVAIINLAVSGLSLPMYMFGKRIRVAVAISGFHQSF
jgi:MFS family permease